MHAYIYIYIHIHIYIYIYIYICTHRFIYKYIYIYISNCAGGRAWPRSGFGMLARFVDCQHWVGARPLDCILATGLVPTSLKAWPKSCKCPSAFTSSDCAKPARRTESQAARMVDGSDISHLLFERSSRCVLR